MSFAFTSLVVLVIDDQRIAVPVEVVERVVRAVKVVPLPDAPRGVLGVVNVGGVIVPVFDVRQRLALPPRPLHINDHLVITRTSRLRMALIVDAVVGVLDGDDEAMTPAAEIGSGLSSIEGVMKLHGDMVLIENVERFLSGEEHAALDQALGL